MSFLRNDSFFQLQKMPKHKICDTNNSLSTSTSEDSDDERLNALASEAVDPVLHKSLYNTSHTKADKDNKCQGNILGSILIGDVGKPCLNCNTTKGAPKLLKIKSHACL